MGRLLLSAGLILACAGLVVMLLERFHVFPGRLPGDIVMRGKSMTFYFPVVTCVLISMLGTLVMWLVNGR